LEGLAERLAQKVMRVLGRGILRHRGEYDVGQLDSPFLVCTVLVSVSLLVARIQEGMGGIVVERCRNGMRKAKA
jgi:hypothetical protein